MKMNKKYKIKCFSSWGLDLNSEHEKQVEIYVDTFPKEQKPDGVIRIMFLLEPPEIMNITGMVMQNQGLFDYILSHNQEVLDHCDNAYLFEFGGSWIKNYEFPEKEFSVSTLVGGKTMALGHFVRHKIWFKENKITEIPTNFYISGSYSGGIENYNNNPVLGDKKDPLFNSMFHIVIENTKRENWFTEKLIDCFQTKTIPIYWGCPNIGDWFDTDGMIIINDANEAIKACNLLRQEDYNNRIQVMERNFEKSNEFADLNERLKTKITEIV